MSNATTPTASMSVRTRKRDTRMARASRGRLVSFAHSSGDALCTPELPCLFVPPEDRKPLFAGLLPHQATAPRALVEPPRQPHEGTGGVVALVALAFEQILVIPIADGDPTRIRDRRE